MSGGKGAARGKNVQHLVKTSLAYFGLPPDNWIQFSSNDRKKNMAWNDAGYASLDMTPG